MNKIQTDVCIYQHVMVFQSQKQLHHHKCPLVHLSVSKTPQLLRMIPISHYLHLPSCLYPISHHTYPQSCHHDPHPSASAYQLSCILHICNHTYQPPAFSFVGTKLKAFQYYLQLLTFSACYHNIWLSSCMKYCTLKGALQFAWTS